MNTPTDPLYYVILCRPTGSKCWTPELCNERMAGNFFATKPSAITWMDSHSTNALDSWIEDEKRCVPIEYTVGAVVLTLSDTNVGNTKH